MKNTIKALENKALKEAVNVHGVGGLSFKTKIAKLPEPLYCFTREELNKFKQMIREDERMSN